MRRSTNFSKTLTRRMPRGRPRRDAQFLPLQQRQRPRRACWMCQPLLPQVLRLSSSHPPARVTAQKVPGGGPHGAQSPARPRRAQPAARAKRRVAAAQTGLSSARARRLRSRRCRSRSSSRARRPCSASRARAAPPRRRRPGSYPAPPRRLPCRPRPPAVERRRRQARLPQVRRVRLVRGEGRGVSD